MIVVHHLEASRSQRVLWLLEELGLEYEVQRYDRDRKTRLAPPSLRAVHPLGKSPVITDGGITVAETGAIVEYLIGTYGKGRLIPPEGTDERRRYTYWLHHAEGSAMPFLVMKLVFDEMPKQAPFVLKPLMRAIGNKVGDAFLDPNLGANIRFWEDALANSAWFAGDALTGADIMMSFPIEAANTRGLLRGNYPRLNAFLAAIHARPAWQRALERGGPYPFA
ncbi:MULTISPECIES: glutathione S-transferase [Acidiphilium]|jgi:glutathione S-transferase|uniref:glutathione transferase n=1 Tax=Acidiphilium cryptum (strain JF-5) TaxID=349163 RepID=A5FV57_ACICJ|nr:MULTISPECIES: glutathione S-transferase [Acidiphilium]MBU6357856.1 glutathione S-transferase [Rhodospirillales bacterium]ABQ29489.1 Glutathione S-transferase, N-terminal domain protein [Acidiphilium cryptum JF-5]EGO94659.1 Glutathione S-transferase domain-containing protein [Acidiphilium sp. PM]KDM66368.1 glutathione S-transferase domain-containing protein [Acidiphilium sp. JA12-A1]MDE2328742.1 glutathione S-transferase [Rhodospirillales bacterium]